MLLGAAKPIPSLPPDCDRMKVLNSHNGPDLHAQKRSRGKATTHLWQLSSDLQALSSQVNRAIVQILATGYVSSFGSNGPSNALLRKQSSSGSGVILDPNGYIVTNAHVVEGARRIQVVLAQSPGGATSSHSILKSRGRMVGAQIVGIDQETDLAVLKIPQSSLPYLTLGDSDRLLPRRVHRN